MSQTLKEQIEIAAPPVKDLLERDCSQPDDKADAKFQIMNASSHRGFWELLSSFLLLSFLQRLVSKGKPIIFHFLRSESAGL